MKGKIEWVKICNLELYSHCFSKSFSPLKQLALGSESEQGEKFFISILFAPNTSQMENEGRERE
mgnify:CR=1 FL=1